MKVEEGVRVLVGILLLIAVALVSLVSIWWLLFIVFIGINLIQSAFTGICPAIQIMKKLGLKE